MITVHFHTRHADGSSSAQAVQAQPGASLMQAAVAANVAGIAADCGGLLTCSTCHVFVQSPWDERLPAAADDELGMLEFTATARAPNSRLSCQITLSPEHDGLSVELPASQY